jgi:Mg2+ and Co2+ transporter CorA
MKVFSIHPLTTEDIQMEESREKIELFRHYYFVCFRSFDQDPYSPTHLEPLNMYIIVFREGTLSVRIDSLSHFFVWLLTPYSFTSAPLLILRMYDVGSSSSKTILV